MATTSLKTNFSSPVNVRLSPEKHFLYQAHAEALGKSYSVYLRERLESQDPLLDELRSLHHKIDTSVLKKSYSDNNDLDQSILIEILFLLRGSSTPSRLQMIHGELRRQGLKVWDDSQGPLS